MQLWTNDHQEWYRTVYLVSDHWKDLRARKLKANPFCERCGVRARDVHHVNYRNIFDVELGDLLSLCRPCHDTEHRENGMPKRSKPRFKDDFERELHAKDQERIAHGDARQRKQAACEAARLNRVWTKEEKKAFCDRKRARDFAKKYPLLARKLSPRKRGIIAGQTS